GVAIIRDAPIDNLSADKITTGTLDADRIAAKSITGPKLADGTVGTVQLGDTAVTRIKIGLPAGDTLQVAGNAITANVAAYFPNSVTFNAWDTEVELMRLSTDAMGGAVTVLVHFDSWRSDGRMTSSLDPTTIIRVRRNGTLLRERT